MTEFMSAAAEGAGEHGSEVLFTLFGLDVTPAITTMWAIMALIIVFSFIVTRTLERVPRTRLQAAVELVFESLEELFKGILGDRARGYLPLLISFFLFIVVSNYSGLIPGAGHFKGFMAPTSRWGVTAGLAVIVFFAQQYFGIKEKGLGYFKHFVDPPFLAPLMLPLGILEELVKPFSLSLRLFANIFGGETVLAALLLTLPVLVPISVLALEVIFGLVQAMIFTMLAAVYFANATAEDH